MSKFTSLKFQPDQAFKSIVKFRTLLQKSELSEKEDLLPFFERHPQLVLLAGLYSPEINVPEKYAKELILFGKFRCDFAVGDAKTPHFCLIEFEDARRNSIFKPKTGRISPEWGARFEHGYSQVVDWFYILDDQRGTAQIRDHFGSPKIDYIGLLIIGRRRFLDQSLQDRLDWRTNHTIVHSKKIHCLTLGELYETLAEKLRGWDYEIEPLK
jgi:hypothetical protein